MVHHRILLFNAHVSFMQAIAAFEGRSEVTPEDIYRVIPLCLR